MKAYCMMDFDYDDKEKIPYPVVCETVSSAKWETGKRKRLYNEYFTESERKRIPELCRLARKWYLVTGFPIEGTTMRTDTFILWNKLAEFCCMI